MWAFVFVDPATGARLLISVSDLPLMFDSVHCEATPHTKTSTQQRTSCSRSPTHTAARRVLPPPPLQPDHDGLPSEFGAIASDFVEAVEVAHDDVAPVSSKFHALNLHGLPVPPIRAQPARTSSWAASTASTMPSTMAPNVFG